MLGNFLCLYQVICHPQTKQNNMLIYDRRVSLIFVALLNLIIASCISHKIINQEVIFILINVYALFAELFAIVKRKELEKIMKGLSVTSKVLSVLGFFILTTNVFVFKNGEKPCDHCTIINVYWIVVGGLYILYYLMYLICTFLNAYISKAK